jgi:hypothetical protein
MVQVSIAAFAVSGFHLGLAYFDVYYSIVAITMVSKALVVPNLREQSRLLTVIRPPLMKSPSLRPSLDRA